MQGAVFMICCFRQIKWFAGISSVQFSSFAQSCPTLCDPVNHSTPGLPVHHQLPEFTQTDAHRVGDAVQPSHPLSSPSPPAPNPSQHQCLFHRVNSSHQVAKVLEFQLQHQSFQFWSKLSHFYGNVLKNVQICFSILSWYMKKYLDIYQFLWGSCTITFIGTQVWFGNWIKF